MFILCRSWESELINQDLEEDDFMPGRTPDHEYEERHIDKKEDKSHVASTFIKYLAYVIIFFGFLWFLVEYVFPRF